MAGATIGNKNALILRNHGPVACGKDLEEAVLAAKVVEKACGIYLNTLRAERFPRPSRSSSSILSITDTVLPMAGRIPDDEKLYFGSNLKMYKNAKETANYLQKLYTLTKDISREEAELFILPSYTSLGQAAKQIDQSYIRLGAQNMCWEDQGQFTGEISRLCWRNCKFRW